jgi:hypothetical protein
VQSKCEGQGESGRTRDESQKKIRLQVLGEGDTEVQQREDDKGDDHDLRESDKGKERYERMMPRATGAFRSGGDKDAAEGRNDSQVDDRTSVEQRRGMSSTWTSYREGRVKERGTDLAERSSQEGGDAQSGEIETASEHDQLSILLKLGTVV